MRTCSALILCLILLSGCASTRYSASSNEISVKAFTANGCYNKLRKQARKVAKELTLNEIEPTWHGTYRCTGTVR